MDSAGPLCWPVLSRGRIDGAQLEAVEAALRAPELRDRCKLVAVHRVRLLGHLVAVSLSGLRQQYEWSGVCGLKTKSEVQENERIDVKCCQPDYVDENPNPNDDRLSDEESGRTKQASEGFCL